MLLCLHRLSSSTSLHRQTISTSSSHLQPIPQHVCRIICSANSSHTSSVAMEDDAGQSSTVAVMWFRRDLRLTDNPALLEATNQKGRLLPVYCLNQTDFAPRKSRREDGTLDEPLLQLPKLGPWRCKFLLQALNSLRDDLRTLGSDLVVRAGSPDQHLAQIVSQLAATQKVSHISLHYSGDLLSESVQLEEDVQKQVANMARAYGVSCSFHPEWSLTMYHPDDLPYEHMAKAAGVPPKEAAALRSNSKQSGGKQQQQPLINGTPQLLQHLAPVMTDFRKVLGSAGTKVRQPLPAPTALPPLPSCYQPQDGTVATGEACQQAAEASEQPIIISGAIPQSTPAAFEAVGAGQQLKNLQDVLGIDVNSLTSELSVAGQWPQQSAFQLQGGEKQALTRLRQYIWGREEGASMPGPPDQPPSLTYYTNSRAQAVGDLSSTKLSPYIGLGCLSPRTVWWEVAAARQAAAAAGVPELACDWLGMHLQIRDYYLFTALKEGDGMMTETGIKGQPVEWTRDVDNFNRWATGRTGLPFVDASMRELCGSGWSSNRSRQNTASFLAKELGVDWRMGAQLFECLLLDHDLGVNYCNWNYFAGTGTDPRNRRFKTVSQGMQYDEDAELAKAWLPELRHLPTQFRHAPWDMSPEQAAQYGYQPGVTYPEPIVDAAGQTGALPSQDPAAAAKRAKKQAKQKAKIAQTMAA